MKIAIIGTDDLGGYIGGCLAQGGQDVTFIARGESLQVISEKCLQVHRPRGDFLVNPFHATNNPDDVGSVDLVLFSVKSYGAGNALDNIWSMVVPKTTVLPVLTGIEHIAKMQARLDGRQVL